MKKYKQLISDPEIGDCFRACIATLLQIPPHVLPNDHSPFWWSNWQRYLNQFGIELSLGGFKPTDPIWLSTPWIATVPSLNYENGHHAILMHYGGIVFHDPSTKKRYRTGISLLGESVVLEGKHLVVADASKLHCLEAYRSDLLKSPKLKGLM